MKTTYRKDGYSKETAKPLFYYNRNCYMVYTNEIIKLFWFQPKE